MGGADVIANYTLSYTIATDLQWMAITVHFRGNSSCADILGLNLECPEVYFYCTTF